MEKQIARLVQVGQRSQVSGGVQDDEPRDGHSVLLVHLIRGELELGHLLHEADELGLSVARRLEEAIVLLEVLGHCERKRKETNCRLSNVTGNDEDNFEIERRTTTYGNMTMEKSFNMSLLS